MKTDFLNSRHYFYNESVEQEKFLTDSYIGGELYTKKGKHLFKYINENQTKFEKRAERSFFINFLQPIISEIKNTIFAEEVQRDCSKKETFDIFVKSATKSGESLDEFMQDLAIYGSLYKVGVLVDGSEYSGEIEKSVRDKFRLFPSVKLFMPHQILDYFQDENGVIKWVLLDCSYRDKSVFGSVRDIKKYVYWDNQKFVIYLYDNDDETPEIQEVAHNLGVVPFFFFNKKELHRDPLARPVYEDIALLQKAIYNYLSLIDEDVYSSIMPMLLAKVSQNPFNEEGKSGTGFSLTKNVFYYDEVPPQLLKTDYLDPTTLISIIELLQKEIFRKVGKYLDANNMYAQSGTAKTIDNQQRSNNLANFARQLENAENKILALYALWQQVDFAEYDMSVYPTKFDTLSLSEKVDEALKLNSLFVGSATAQNAVKKDLINLHFGDKLTVEEKQKIENELLNPQPDFQ